MKYIYIKQHPKSKNNTKHGGVVCVGYKYDDNNATIYISTSFCNPQDRFSKKRAHKIIEGRMNVGKFMKIITDKLPTYEDMLRMVYAELNHPSTVETGKFCMVNTPSWLHDMYLW